MSTPINFAPIRTVLQGFVGNFPNWSHTTPFTYQDGLTNAKLLESIVDYITDVLTPYIDSELEAQINMWVAQMQTLIESLDDSMSEFEDELAAQLAANLAAVNTAIQAVIDNSELQESVILAIFQNATSDLREYVDTIYASKSIEAVVTSQGASIEALETSIASKAEASDVSSISTRVASAESDISQIQTTLPDKAEKTDIIVPRNSLANPIIATHFLRADEAIYVALSLDGENFDETNIRWKPLDNDELGRAFARDPSIVSYGGFYYIAYTRIGTTLGGAFGTTNSVGLVRVSSDFSTWTPMDPIRMPGTPINTWAPEWYVPENGVPQIIVAIKASSSDQFKQYLITPSNNALTAWGAPVEMVGLTGNIDASIVKHGNVFHAFVANQPEMRMKHYTATNILGPYTLLADSDINDPSFAGLEGPSIVKLDRGGWRMYLDAYGQVDSIYYTDSFNLLDWTPIKAVSLPMRHIGTVQVDAIPVRKYPDLETNLVASKFDTTPYWGAKRNPSDVDKEWVETITVNTGSSWHQVLPISQMGFTGVDGVFAQVAHGDNLDVASVRIQIPADNVLAITLMNFSGNIMTNKTAKVSYRVIGWGPKES